MKFAYLTDVHLKGLSPSKRKDIYYLSILKKLHEIGIAVKNNNLDFIIIGGDLTDGPKISTQLYSTLAQIIRSWKVPVFVVPGNHDLYGQNLNSIRHTTLGALASSGVINLIARNNSPIVIKKPNEPIIAITGQEYYQGIDTGINNDYEINKTNQRIDYNILVVHSMLVDKPFFEGTDYTLMKDVVSSADLILSGHYHPDCISKTYNGIKFIKPNSTARVEATKYNFDNKPCYSIIEITSSGIKDTFIEYSSALEGKDIFGTLTKDDKQGQMSLEVFKNNLNNTTIINNVNYKNILDDIVKKNNISSPLALKIEEDINKNKSKLEESIIGYIPSNIPIQISKVVIHNFQSHKHSEIEFEHNTLNAIMGESNKGKTSILRAIEWCLYDSPKGSSFIKRGENECYVEIEFSNGNKLKRCRSKNSAGYYETYDVKTNTTNQYKGFSHNIPVEVYNIHQMPKISMGKNKQSLNIAKQLEGAFMLSNSSFDKANIIGKFVGCDFIDETISEVNKKILATNKDIDSSNKKVEELDKKIESFGYLEDKLKIIEKLELIDNEIDILSIKKKDFQELIDRFNNIAMNKQLSLLTLSKIIPIEKLNIIINDIESNNKLLIAYKSINDTYINNANEKIRIMAYLQASPDINKLNLLLDIITDFNDKYNLYNDFNSCLKRIKSYQIQEQQYINKKENICNFDYEKLFNLKNELDEICNLNEILKLIKNQMVIQENIIKNCSENITTLKEELANIFKDLKVCPICGSSLEQCADKIINS